MIVITKRSHALLCAILASGIFATQTQAAECDFSEMDGTLIDFGVHPVGAQGPLTGMKLVQFNCSNPVGLSTSYTASISTGSSGTFSTRTLEFGGRTINYNLYTNGLYTNVFGNGEVGTNTSVVSGACLNNAACAITVFGRINSGQQLSAGQFTDEVVMTLTF